MCGVQSNNESTENGTTNTGNGSNNESSGGSQAGINQTSIMGSPDILRHTYNGGEESNDSSTFEEK